METRNLAANFYGLSLFLFASFSSLLCLDIYYITTIDSDFFEPCFSFWLQHICFDQRPKKSELSGWQLSTCKNFPDEVRKLFLRQKVCVNRFRNKKCA